MHDLNDIIAANINWDERIRRETLRGRYAVVRYQGSRRSSVEGFDDRRAAQDAADDASRYFGIRTELHLPVRATVRTLGDYITAKLAPLPDSEGGES